MPPCPYHNRNVESMKGEFIIGLSLREQETIIAYDRESREMNIYTADAALLRRLIKLDAYELVREHRKDGQVIAADFKADKSLCFLRSKVLKRDLTEEQRAELADRLRKSRERKAQNQI